MFMVRYSFFLLIFAILCIEVAYGVKKPYKIGVRKGFPLIIKIN